jgi:hypothetical protein
MIPAPFSTPRQSANGGDEYRENGRKGAGATEKVNLTPLPLLL